MPPDDVTCEKADAEAAWEPAPAQPGPEDDHDREAGRRRGLFRRRPCPRGKPKAITCAGIAPDHPA
ncbi:hypothetical protein [Streptomyces hesseae]|uniref:Uncharacterized protein n=1 Tax=Streptomyces hesseae TaxID=3075519 RepID=A0ABU2SWC5_9ACTN|nr:hypothetical protein [Streptomyces sp. DSM 40473]MDT0453157.1 hypothetical protein [Streptomyces sp. DSM 40473]